MGVVNKEEYIAQQIRMFRASGYKGIDENEWAERRYQLYLESLGREEAEVVPRVSLPPIEPEIEGESTIEEKPPRRTDAIFGPSDKGKAPKVEREIEETLNMEAKETKTKNWLQRRYGGDQE